MKNSIFESVQNNKGMVGILNLKNDSGLQQNDATKPKCMAIAWKSPHASFRANQQLERELRKTYVRYYTRVMIESFGEFWD